MSQLEPTQLSQSFQAAYHLSWLVGWLSVEQLEQITEILKKYAAQEERIGLQEKALAALLQLIPLSTKITEEVKSVFVGGYKSKVPAVSQTAKEGLDRYFPAVLEKLIKDQFDIFMMKSLKLKSRFLLLKIFFH